jgi:hypothetical protein
MLTLISKQSRAGQFWARPTRLLFLQQRQTRSLAPDRTRSTTYQRFRQSTATVWSHREELDSLVEDKTLKELLLRRRYFTWLCLGDWRTFSVTPVRHSFPWFRVTGQTRWHHMLFPTCLEMHPGSRSRRTGAQQWGCPRWEKRCLP